MYKVQEKGKTLLRIDKISKDTSSNPFINSNKTTSVIVLSKDDEDRLRKK